MTGGLSLVIEVDDELLQRRLRDTYSGLEKVVGLIAEDLAHEAALEGSHAAPSLGEPWEVVGTTGTVRRVVAPQWWAHFVAHGTQAHGPKYQTKLHLFIGEDELFLDEVAGMSADPFDERAVERTKSHLSSIIERAVAG